MEASTQATAMIQIKELNKIEDLFRELLGYEEGLRNSQQAVLDKQANVRLFERHIKETMDKIKGAMGDSNEWQFKYEGMIIDFYHTTPRLSVDMPNIEAVPEQFIKLEKIAKKTEIKKYLDEGHKPNWASLKPGESKLSYKILKN